MTTRRSFLIKSSLAALALGLPLPGCTRETPPAFSPPKAINRALVVWNSQTGNTQRTGTSIARAMEAKGVSVDTADHRELDTQTLNTYDLVVTGTPVHYFDIPKSYRTWLDALPSLEGIPVASYVTFGGAGHNQHNTACRVLETLTAKGGIPMGFATFGNLSMYAITWSTGREARILKYRHLPDEASCNAMRTYGETLLIRTLAGDVVPSRKTFFPLDMLKGGPSIWGAKLLLDRHGINKETCIGCRACVETCPVGAVNLETGSIDADLCLFCLGCLNNCPVGAMEMVYRGKNVEGFHAFSARHNLTIHTCT